MVLVDKLRGQVHQLVFNTSAFLSLGIVSLAAAGSWEHSCRSSSAVVCVLVLLLLQEAVMQLRSFLFLVVGAKQVVYKSQQE